MLTSNGYDRGKAEMVLDLLLYLGSAEVQVQLTLANQTVPANTAALNDPDVQAIYEVARFGESMHLGTPMANHPYGYCQWGAVGEATFAVWSGALEPLEAMNQAQAAIEQAQRESADAQRRYTDALRECDKSVFVNPCREQARQERDRQLRTIREKEVAARDTLRRLDAEERARARGERAAEPKTRGGTAPQAKEPATAAPAAPRTAVPRVVEPTQQGATAAKKPVDAASRKAESEKRAAEHAAERERRAAEQAEKAAQAPAEIERFEERQRAAQARAEEKKRIAEENRKRREKRAEKRDAAKEKAGTGGAP
jgi:hypothetical protein